MKRIILLAVFACALLFSCSNDDETPINENNASNGEIVKENGNTTISGSTNYEYSTAFEKAKYIVTFKEKTLGCIDEYSIFIPLFNSWTNLLPGSSSSLNATTGFYESTDIVGFSDNETWNFKVKATDNWEIIYQKLPLSVAPAALPQVYTGAGRRVFGPFSVTGTATFTIKTANAMHAGFTAELFNANGTDMLDADYHVLYTNLTSGNTTNVTISRNDLAAGSYYINIDANGGASYTVEVK